MLDKLSSVDFTPYLHQQFAIHYGGDQPLIVELIKVETLGTPPGDPERRQPFSLIFRGPKEAYLLQHIYRIEHAAIGSLEIFIVPIGPDKDGMCYEALFN